MKWFALSALPVVLACSKGPDGTALEIDVAALDLPGISEACYDLWVTNGPNGTGDVVWRKDGVCTTRFGNGLGDITYIGTCDADGPGTSSPSRRANTVSLSLVDLWTGADGASLVAHDTYQNPCGTDDAANNDGFGPCQRTIDCVENADSRVTFDITVMRDAEQGFFDFAVNFEDVFCSAKLDCGANLLFAADGERHETLVMAFACSAGSATRASGGDTHLYMSDVAIYCDDGSRWELPVGVHDAGENGGGNQLSPPGTYADADSDPIYQWAVYSDTEELGADAVPPFTKAFWNVSVGFDVSDLAGRDCRIKATATASDGPLEDPAPGFTPAGTTYPIVVWDAALNDGTGALTCGANALDAIGGTTVYTGYTTTPTCFDNHGFVQAGAFVTVDNPCPTCNGFDCQGSCCPYGNLCSDGLCVSPPTTCMSFTTTVRDGGVCVTDPCPKTCLEIRDAVPNAQSGTYLVDPDGTAGAAPFPVRCDMDYDGGGWTLVAHERAGNPDPAWSNGTLQYLARDSGNAAPLASGAADGIIGVRFPYGATYGSARFNWCDPTHSDNLFARFDTPEGLFVDTRRDCDNSASDPLAACAFYAPGGDNTITLSGFETNDAFLQSQVPTQDDARFCRAATMSPSYRPGDTSWALKGPVDDYFECGCNSGGWAGVGAYYGGEPDGTQSICIGWGGGFAGSVTHRWQKGSINSNQLHIWIR